MRICAIVLALFTLGCASKSRPAGLPPAGCGQVWAIASEVAPPLVDPHTLAVTRHFEVKEGGITTWDGWKAHGLVLVTNDGDSLRIVMRQHAATRESLSLHVEVEGYGRNLGEIELHRDKADPCIYAQAKTDLPRIIFYSSRDPNFLRKWRELKAERDEPDISSGPRTGFWPALAFAVMLASTLPEIVR